jgi:aspartate racemase
MKTIGLLGGMSWESTSLYYRLINQRVAHQRGGLSSAKILLASVDMAEMEVFFVRNDWQEVGVHLGRHAKALSGAGADFVAICSNTTHLVADAVSQVSGLPLVHIVDVTAAAAKTAGMHRVGLLGTRFTMSMPFYRERLERHGLEVLLPEPSQCAEVDRMIFEELCRGQILDTSREALRAVVDSLGRAGADGVILGCTELSLLLRDGDATVPLLDTTEIHARAIADFALAEPSQGVRVSTATGSVNGWS